MVAVVNFPPRQIGPVRSEVLVLGASNAEGRVILLAPIATCRSGRGSTSRPRGRARAASDPLVVSPPGSAS